MRIVVVVAAETQNRPIIVRTRTSFLLSDILRSWILPNNNHATRDLRVELLISAPSPDPFALSAHLKT
jgi:hypothetical protein